MFVYKVLGQAAPLGGVETDVYTVPASKQAVISTLVCCNRGGVQSAFRFSVSVGGAATTDKDYLYYDVQIDVGDTFVTTIGITMAAGDVVRCYAANANLSFAVFGSELI